MTAVVPRESLRHAIYNGADRHASGVTTVRAAARAHPELALTMVPNQWPEHNYFQTSDQMVFARSGMPSIFF